MTVSGGVVGILGRLLAQVAAPGVLPGESKAKPNRSLWLQRWNHVLHPARKATARSPPLLRLHDWRHRAAAEQRAEKAAEDLLPRDAFGKN